MGSLYSWAQTASIDELIVAAKADAKNDSVSMNEIVWRFDGKAVNIARALTGDPHLLQDVANAARWGVVMAVRAHREGTPGFPSYAAMTMRGEANRSLGRNRADGKEIVLECDSAIWHGEAVLRETVSILETNLDLLMKGLSPDQRHLVLARYAEGYGVGEIATRLGTSASAVSQRFKTIHKVVSDSAMRYEIPAA